MQLTHTGKRFEVVCRFGDGGAERAKAAGFAWSSSSKKFYTGSAEVARSFLPEADPSAKAIIDYHLTQVTASYAASSSLSLVAPEGEAYLPFQLAGVAYTAPRPAALNADEPGLGKTIQAIGQLNTNKPARAAFCVPAGLKINWKREIGKWKTRDWSVGIADGKTIPKTDILIFNYEQGVNIAPYLDEVDWGLICFDEAHMLKNPEARRTQSLLGYYEKKRWVIPPVRAQQYLFMTGTPILNRPVELFPMLRLMDPDGLGRSYYSFAERYCNGHNSTFGYDATGASHLDELRGKLRGSCMVRRLKRDVLPELPPKRRQVVPIAQGTARRAITEELHTYEQYRADIDAARTRADALYRAGHLEDYRAAINALEYKQRIAFDAMASMRHATALAKVPFAKAFIDTILEESNKLIVFYHHKDVLQSVFEKYASFSVFVDGSMIDVEKQHAVDLFQQQHKCRIMFMSIQAAVGWTLTAAARELFIEFDWRWGIQKQAEDRADRIGQLESLFIQYLVFDGSLEALMVQNVVRKLEIEEQALDG